MHSLPRALSIPLALLFVCSLASCGRDRAGAGALAGRRSIFHDAGSASCTDICSNLRRIDSLEPDCPLDIPPDCEAQCSTEEAPPGIAACFAGAADCAALIACVEEDPDPDPDPPPTVDAGGGGFDAGGGGFDAGPAVDSGGGGVLCTDTCSFAGDGECDDGGEGSMTAVCEFGTDCTDCGARFAG